MMDIGTGIAVGSSVLGAVAIIFRVFPASKNTNETSSHNQCSQHAAIVAQHADMNDWLYKIEAKLDRVIERRNAPRDL
jgi:hypothetical protein